MRPSSILLFNNINSSSNLLFKPTWTIEFLDFISLMISFISFSEKEIGFSQKTCLLFLIHLLIKSKCVGVGEEITTASIS